MVLPLVGGQAEPKECAPITFDVQVIRTPQVRPSYEKAPRAPRYRPPSANLLRADFRAQVTATAAYVD